MLVSEGTPCITGWSLAHASGWYSHSPLALGKPAGEFQHGFRINRANLSFGPGFENRLLSDRRVAV